MSTVSIDPRGQAMGDLIARAWVSVARPAHASGKRIHWYPALSAPLPASWPSRGDGLVVWAYARGVDEQLEGSERVSTPWAKLTIRAPGAAPVLEPSPQAIVDLGVQALRERRAGGPRMPPMSEAERALFEHMARAPIGPPSETTKQPWCAWLRHNDVIAEALRPHHRDFFDWLSCP